VSAPPEHARIANVDGESHCGTCGDSGWVVVSVRPVAASGFARRFGIEPASGAGEEEYGPCPWCQAGYAVEWQKGGSRGNPWGRNGFWRGRDPLALLADGGDEAA
jgi:hypothetical protein